MNARQDFDNDDMDLAERSADPGGRSALHPATRGYPRNLPCPTCGARNRLTRRDHVNGYQCNTCADRDEGRLG